MVLFVPMSKRRGRGRAAWLQVMQGLVASKPAKIRITTRPSPEPVQPSACRSPTDYQLAFFFFFFLLPKASNSFHRTGIFLLFQVPQRSGLAQPTLRGAAVFNRFFFVNSFYCVSWRRTGRW